MPISGTSIPIFRFWVAVLCGYLALGATLQALPKYVALHFHAGPFIVGSIISIASLAAAFARPIAGYAADNGFARRVVLISSLFSVLGGVGHWYAPNLSILLISRLFLGAGEGALFTGAVSLVIYNCAPEKRGAFAGWFGLSMWGGLCAGPILAMWFSNIFGNNLSIWSLVTALPVIGLILILTTSVPRNAAHQQNRKYLALLPRGAQLPGLAFLLTSYGYGSINAMLILYLGYHHLGGTNIALPIFAACFLITRIAGSPLVNLFGGRWVLLTFIIIEMIGLLLITTSLLPVILIGTGLTGIGVAMLYPAFVAVIVQRTPSIHQGAAIGFMTSFWDLGLVIAGPIGGIIASRAGFNIVFLMATIFALVSFFIILGPLNRRERDLGS